MLTKKIVSLFYYTVFVLVFCFVSSAWAAEPVIFFLDMTDGPTTGWEGSSTKGAAVSIWGINFGTSRGTSYVTVGGVNLTNDSDYAEWGATTNPTTANGQQRITFYLNSSMSTSGVAPNFTISVTTSDGTSNSISFHCRALGTNKIYFVKINGNDSLSGQTVANAWASFTKVRESVVAGDVVYFKSGIWIADDGNGAVLQLRTTSAGTNHTNGTVYNSIILASYPGELAQVGDGTNTITDKGIYRNYNTTTSILEYWTFSKFKFYNYSRCFGWCFGGASCEDNDIRIIGNDVRTTYAAIGTGISINPYTSATNFYLLGNYIHHAGKANDSDPHGYGVPGLYWGGGGQSTNIDVGWNEFAHNNGTVQFYGHFDTDRISNLYFHNNYVHDGGTSVLVLGGGDPSNGTQYTFIQSAYVYNNIFARHPGDVRVDWGSNGTGGNYKLYNNLFHNYYTKMLHVVAPASFVFKNNIVYSDNGGTGYWYNDSFGANPPTNVETGSNNCWYGQGDGPSWDSNSLDNTTPQFISGAPVNFVDFQLRSNSPCIGKGSSSVSSIVKYDFNGIARPQIDTVTGDLGYDIGAFEYIVDPP